MRFWIFQAGHDHHSAAAPAPRAATTVYMIGYDCWGVAPCPQLSSPPVIGLAPDGCPDGGDAPPETEPRRS